jgi:hypothetical protein
MTDFRITRIKPAFINREVLAQVAADALAKLNPETTDGKRWTRAIAKAVATIEQIRKWFTISALHPLKLSERAPLITRQTAVASVMRTTAVIRAITGRLHD